MEKVSLIIDKSIDKIINETANIVKIADMKKRHDVKIHFIPKRYRVLGGLLQSMNIKFGDFVEELFQELVNQSEDYTLEELSGTSRKKFSISRINDSLIDTYITNSQNQYSNTNADLKVLFDDLISNVNTNSLLVATDNYQLSHDIDLFFKENHTENYFYAEIKYNDDHDSGKYVDINRKFIKTYAYLYEELLNKYDRDPSKFTLKPCMFFFTNKKMMGNIFLPEIENIYRGQEIFEEFFDYIQYSDIDAYLSHISENEETIEKFDNLYKSVMELVVEE